MSVPAKRDAEGQVASSVIRSVDDLGRVATMAAASGYFKDKNTPQRAGAAMALAQSMGFAPVVGLTSIDIIDGKPSPSAQLLASAIDRHPDYEYDCIESSTERAVLAFYRRNPATGKWRERGRVEWTMKDAERAGLAGKGNWRKHPRPMLFWRAMTEGARLFCPDILSGTPFYAPEELRPDESVNPETGEVIVEEPEFDRPDAQALIEAEQGEVVEEPEPEPEPKISQKDRRTMFKIGRECGFDDDGIRAVVAEVAPRLVDENGRASTGDMTRDEMLRVEALMKERNQAPTIDQLADEAFAGAAPEPIWRGDPDA